MAPYFIVLADDHVMFRKGIKRIIADVAGLKVIGESSDGIELMQLLRKSSPDMVILDISMPRLRGLEAAKEIKRLYPKVKILFLTMHRKKEFIRMGLETGAEGFLIKEDADSELIQAIKTIREGKKFISALLTPELTALALEKSQFEPLTTREREVLKLLGEGKYSKEIADFLYISIHTVRRHRSNIMRKLNLKNLATLIRYAIDHDYIDPKKSSL